MTVTINVNAYTVNSAGEMEPFGGNSQSSGIEFNILNDTLKKHLGKEAYYWGWALGQDHFVIRMDMETDEGIPGDSRLTLWVAGMSLSFMMDFNNKNTY